MAKVIGVRFKEGGKIYFFDPADIEISKGDYVIVDTARGLECGLVVQGIHTESDDKIVKPLKAVSRIDTKQDIEKLNLNRRDEKKAIEICLEKIEKQQNINSSLSMQVDELASLSNIQNVAKEYGLSYNNNNVIVIK